jgi:predicted  nucleic acid-binding Zn-ribbon protein
MNKTLLLVICDFLLLNLLALTHWEKAEPAHLAQKPAAAAAAPAANQDLVDMMKLSLEDERRTHAQLAQQLQTREETLARVATQKDALEQNLAATRHSAQELGRQLSAAAEDAAMTKERLAALQRDLEDRQREAARQQQELAGLTKAQAEAQQKIENLNVAVKVAEEEKKMLRETADTLKEQVAAEREERQKVVAQAGVLAEGVGRLADRSGELTKEIHENQPVNANTLFSNFLANRVQVDFTAVRQSFLGPVTRNKAARTVLVADGRQIYALLHVTDTPFSLKELGADWEKLTGTLGQPPAAVPVPALTFLSLDPRIVVVPLDPARAAALGVKIYQTALDPFKFADAVLISSGGRYYGEVAFKLDPQLPQYVKMDNRFFKQLFGDFSPSTGDLVLSKTGELLGLMVNRDYCAVLNNFLPAQTIATGENISAQRTGGTLDGLADRLRALPLKLQ